MAAVPRQAVVVTHLSDLAVWRLAARLVVPVSCAGCDRPDVPLCSACQAKFAANTPLRCEDHAPRLDPVVAEALMPVWGLDVNDGIAKECISRWKDHGRLDLTEFMVSVMVRGASEVARVNGRELSFETSADRRDSTADPLRTDPLLIVPVPSTARSNRARYGQLTDHLARGVQMGLAQQGMAARVASVLRMKTQGRDQSGLGARARQENLAQRVAVRGNISPGSRAFIVDDVQTTGASLAACQAALSSRGVEVVGALVLAYTPDPRLGTFRLTNSVNTG